MRRLERGTAEGFYAFSTCYGTEIGFPTNAPMPTPTTRDRAGFMTATAEGKELALTDIGLRMLSPRALATAMGFLNPTS